MFYRLFALNKRILALYHIVNIYTNITTLNSIELLVYFSDVPLSLQIVYWFIVVLTDKVCSRYKWQECWIRYELVILQIMKIITHINFTSSYAPKLHNTDNYLLLSPVLLYVYLCKKRDVCRKSTQCNAWIYFVPCAKVQIYDHQVDTKNILFITLIIKIVTKCQNRNYKPLILWCFYYIIYQWQLKTVADFPHIKNNQGRSFCLSKPRFNNCRNRWS